VMSLTENLLYLYSTCALPLFLYALERTCRTGRKTWLVWAGLVWASIILNGDIQTAYYVGLVAFIWTILQAEGMRQVGLGLGRLAVVASLTVLVAAIQLAPAWVGYQHSDRAEASSFHAEAIHWSTHPLRFVTLMVAPIGDPAAAIRLLRPSFTQRNRGAGRQASGPKVSISGPS
jgi:uncharacterized membrane protein